MHPRIPLAFLAARARCSGAKQRPGPGARGSSSSRRRRGGARGSAEAMPADICSVLTHLCTLSLRRRSRGSGHVAEVSQPPTLHAGAPKISHSCFLAEGAGLHPGKQWLGTSSATGTAGFWPSCESPMRAWVRRAGTLCLSSDAPDNPRTDPARPSQGTGTTVKHSLARGFHTGAARGSALGRSPVPPQQGPPGSLLPSAPICVPGVFHWTWAQRTQHAGPGPAPKHNDLHHGAEGHQNCWREDPSHPATGNQGSYHRDIKSGWTGQESKKAKERKSGSSSHDFVTLNPLSLSLVERT